MIIKSALFVVLLINKNRLIDGLLLVLIFLSVFHDPILSIDYYNYEKSLRLEQIGRWEPFYQLIGEIAMLFKLSWRIDIFYSITVIIALMVLKRAMKLFSMGYDKVFFILLLIIFPKGFLWIFNLPRQYLAIFFSFYALINLDMYRNKMFIFVSLLSILTHISALPFLLFFYVFNRINFKELVKRKLFIFLLVSLLILSYDLIINFVLEKTIPRLDMIEFLDKSGKSYLYLLAILSILILMFKKEKKWFFFSFYTLFLLFLFDYLGSSAARLAYFVIPYIVYDLVKICGRFESLFLSRFIKVVILIIFMFINLYSLNLNHQ